MITLLCLLAGAGLLLAVFIPAAVLAGRSHTARTQRPTLTRQTQNPYRKLYPPNSAAAGRAGADPTAPLFAQDRPRPQAAGSHSTANPQPRADSAVNLPKM